MQAFKKIAGGTPRQEIISHAALIMRRHSCKVSEAIAAVFDGAKPGTVGGAMLEYWLSLSEKQQGRIEAEIGRNSK